MYGFIDLFLFCLSLAIIVYAIIISTGEDDILGLNQTYVYYIIGFILFLFYPIIPETILYIAAICSTQSIPKIPPNSIPIVYHPSYNITACGLQKLHPFDSSKYGKIFKKIKHLLQLPHLTPQICPRKFLLEIHSFWYLWSLCYSCVLSRMVEVPVCFVPEPLLRLRLVQPMQRATYGSLIGACAAVEKGWSINLSGGYHHCSRSSGGGFCVFADITLAIRSVKKWYPNSIKKVMIIDLDAHQGNGHQRDFLGDQDIFIMDFYNPRIYPNDIYAMDAIQYTQHVTPVMSDQIYLRKLEQALNVCIEQFRPEFILYNAGTDCMEGDPLGRLNITENGIIKRDQIVFRYALRGHIPILMVLSGGYQLSNAPVVAASILNLIQEFNLIQDYKSQIK